MREKTTEEIEKGELPEELREILYNETARQAHLSRLSIKQPQFTEISIERYLEIRNSLSIQFMEFVENNEKRRRIREFKRKRCEQRKLEQWLKNMRSENDTNVYSLQK